MVKLMQQSFTSSEFLSLDQEELALVETKQKGINRLVFAVLLKFFQAEGRYPGSKDLIPEELIVCLAHQLEMDSPEFDSFNWQGITHKRFRKSIREFFDYREATSSDREKLVSWLMNDILKEAPTYPQCLERVYQFFRDSKVEPFSSKKLDRYVRSAFHRFEKEFFLSLSCDLSKDVKKLIDDLLKSDEAEEEDQEETASDIEKIPDKIKLHHLKKDVAGAKLKNVHFEIKKLEHIRSIKLPLSLLQNVSRKFLQKYYLRVLAGFPSYIEKYSGDSHYGTMAVFCYVRSQILTDTLAELFLQLVHKIKRSSETHVIKKVIPEIKRVDGKFDILYKLADAAGNNPEGIIKEVIYPKVSQQKLLDLAEELECKGKWYQEQVQTKMRSLYSHAHRQALLPLLEAFVFKTNTSSGKELLKAIEFIKKHRSCVKEFYPKSAKAPIDVIPNEWRTAVLEIETPLDPKPLDQETKEKRSKEKPKNILYKVRRMNYEIAILEELCRQLQCKSIWIEGAYRYRNPDEDAPQDFDERKEHYYKMLGLPLDPKVFVKELKEKLEISLKELNESILENPKVKIIPFKKGEGGKIKISPSGPQAHPTNLKVLQQYIKRRWANTNLLDVLKETDLRVNFTECFRTVARKEALDKTKLRKRLLLSIYAIGSNTGLMRMGSANKDANYYDLKYTKRRYLHLVNVKAAIVKVVNEIINIRDPEVWGEATTGVACDSTQVSSWDQNLMTEWHPRYHGYGVMVYWHVDKNAAVVHSLLKTCTSSEVGAMITGVLRHDTKMEMNEVYVDTHGQSSIGFCFSYLLNFDLLPRLKNISKQKLYYPLAANKKDYPNLLKILRDSINWHIIEEGYHESIRTTISLKLRTAEADVIIKRFSKDNYTHPVYRALNEIGKATKTIFLCRYLSSEQLRIEIHEALNMVERLNGIMNFIFYGKVGEISTNNKENQELAVACLHLIQVSLVYINTLIIQESLSMPKWQKKLTKEDKRALTALIHSHLNPYGLFPLNLEERLTIETKEKRVA